MKTFYTIIGLIGLFFFSIPIHLFAATEYNPDAIEVDTLPECNQQVVYNVYANNNHYYKCNYIDGGLRTIQVGDNLKGKTLYFSFPETSEFVSEVESYHSGMLGYLFNLGRSVSTTYNAFDDFGLKIFSSGTISFASTNNYCLRNIYKNGELLVDSLVLDTPFSGVESQIYTVGTVYNWVVSNLDINNPAYNYVKISSGSGYYEYEDQGEIPVLYTYDDKDFYLFYDFGMIANLDIFSNYDFTSFTDYQKVVVVIGFNVFYIAILCFFGAIIYKTLARIIRFILG